MKTHILAITGVLLLVAGSAWLYAEPATGSIPATSAQPHRWRVDSKRVVDPSAAAPQVTANPLQSVELLTVDPTAISINRSATITVAAQVGNDASLLPTSVNLLRYNEQGQLIINLGRMYDDRTHGDSVAGDNIFTTQFVLHEPQPTVVSLRASVAYRGLLLRVVSNPTAAFVQSTMTAEQTLSNLADQLDAGDIEQALKTFSPSPLNREALNALDSGRRAEFASSLRGARLVSATDNVRIYQVPYVDREGNRSETEFSLARTHLGEWVIMSW